MTSTRGHFFEKKIKRTHHFVLMITPSLCDVLLFCVFLLLTSSVHYLSLEICFPEICLVFYVSNFYVTLKLFSLFYFNEIYFLERSRYLFNNSYIARSSLMILYPCRYTISCFTQESENITPICLFWKKC